MSTKEAALRLLKIIVDEVERMSDSEIEDRIKGKIERRILSPPHASRPSKRPPLSTEEIGQLLNELNHSTSRDQARVILERDERITTKSNLERIARALQVHVNKHDRRAALADKVIEAVIGVRLRSEAIRGLNLKGSSSTPGDREPT